MRDLRTTVGCCELECQTRIPPAAPPGSRTSRLVETPFRLLFRVGRLFVLGDRFDIEGGGKLERHVPGYLR